MDIENMLDHQRWLMNNGMFTTVVKNNLYIYGSLVHPSVEAVYLQIDTETRLLNYTIYFSSKSLAIFKTIDSLKNRKGIIALWKLKSLLKTYGDTNFTPILQKFVDDYCGTGWQINLTLDNIKNYSESSEDEGDGDRRASKNEIFHK